MSDLPPKRCPDCKETKPRTLEYWYRQLGTKDGLRSICKRCAKKRLNDWNDAHKDQHREQVYRWREKNTERVRETNRAASENYRNTHPKRRERDGDEYAD
jgi:hypothetical protein